MAKTKGSKTKSTEENAGASRAEPSAKPERLGDAELVLLSAGSSREDGLIVAPASLKRVSAQRGAGTLIRRGLAEEVEAGRDGPVWREAEDGRRIALKVTAAGLAAIGEGEPAARAYQAPSSAGRPKEQRSVAAAPDTATSDRVGGPDAPRPGSKSERVIGLLVRPGGAGIDELMAATGWLPHTTRAALTGLRRRGYEVGRDKDGAGRSVYRIAQPEPTPARKGRAKRAAAAG